MIITKLTTWFLCMVSFGALAQTYHYVDYSVPDSFEGGKTRLTLDVASRQIMSSDWVSTVSICDESSHFYCFKYPAVSFFVPKARITLGQTWTVEGVLYEVLRKGHVQIFGLIRETWIIKAARPDRRDFFYYSHDDGLLAIKHVDKNGKQVQFFMVEGQKGFPK